MANDADLSGWTDLLHWSSKLIEQASPSAQFPPLQRNLDQLEALSKKLMAKTLRAEAPAKSIAATRLLAREGLNAEQLACDLESFELKTTFKDVFPAEATTVEEYFRQDLVEFGEMEASGYIEQRNLLLGGLSPAPLDLPSNARLDRAEIMKCTRQQAMARQQKAQERRQAAAHQEAASQGVAVHEPLPTTPPPAQPVIAKAVSSASQQKRRTTDEQPLSPRRTVAEKGKGKATDASFFGPRPDDELFPLPPFPIPRFEPDVGVQNTTSMLGAGSAGVDPLKVLTTGVFLSDQKKMLELGQLEALKAFAYHVNMVGQWGYNFYRRAELALADREKLQKEQEQIEMSKIQIESLRSRINELTKQVEEKNAELMTTVTERSHLDELLRKTRLEVQDAALIGRAVGYNSALRYARDEFFKSLPSIRKEAVQQFMLSPAFQEASVVFAIDDAREAFQKAVKQLEFLGYQFRVEDKACLNVLQNEQLEDYDDAAPVEKNAPVEEAETPIHPRSIKVGKEFDFVSDFAFDIKDGKVDVATYFPATGQTFLTEETGPSQPAGATQQMVEQEVEGLLNVVQVNSDDELDRVVDEVAAGVAREVGGEEAG